MGFTEILESDSLSLEICVEQKTYLIQQELIDKITHQICQWLGVEQFELSIDWLTPAAMQEINREYRHKDRSTDVLSFPQHDWDHPLTVERPYLVDPNLSSDIPRLLGDLLISPADAEQNAHAIGQGLDRETCFLIVHGILHLCGHDHETKEEEILMTTEQQNIMQRLESLSTEPIWTHCARIK